MISYIIPHRNRIEHFKINLESLLHQTSKEFELIVLDSSDDAHRNRLLALIDEYRDKGLIIKVFFIDPTKCKYSHPSNLYHGAYNPAVAQNVGVKKASGGIIALTSPEVINASTNVERAIAAFSDNRSRFLLGWVDERRINQIPALTKGISVEEIKTLCAQTAWGAACRPERWAPEKYFLGFLLKSDFIKIGGIEEKYMAGVAFEDNDFAFRCDSNGFPAELYDGVAGIHLSHSRGYQGNLVSPQNANYVLWNSEKPTIANIDHEWGSDEYITGEH